MCLLNMFCVFVECGLKGKEWHMFFARDFHPVLLRESFFLKVILTYFPASLFVNRILYYIDQDTCIDLNAFTLLLKLGCLHVSSTLQS